MKTKLWVSLLAKFCETKFVLTIFVVTLLFTGWHRGCAQGFLNLDFESSNPQGYAAGSSIPINLAFPGWAAYYASSNNPTAADATVYYDTVNLSIGGVFLVDTNGIGHPTPIQGYSVLLVGPIPTVATSASIGQTGQIPITAQSLTFFGKMSGNLQVTFNAQNIPFSAVGNGANYTVYGADISGYAGQTGELLFTATPLCLAVLDNVQFSSAPIPEPSTIALGAFGSLLLGFYRWHKFVR